MTKKIAIVGAGLMGRFLAYELSEEDVEVFLFDRDAPEVLASCSHACGGMLAPILEREIASDFVTEAGLLSLPLWQNLAERFPNKFFFQREGSLVVSHVQDQSNLEILKSKLEKSKWQDQVEICSRERISELEPELPTVFQNGVFVAGEGQACIPKSLMALHGFLSEQKNVQLIFEAEVDQIQPHHLKVQGEEMTFDQVVDCRGFWAEGDLKDLRAVRGEIVRVQAPEVTLNRPVRLMHPRYPIYVIPRGDHRFLIGATSIESHDRKSVTVRSALELLSAAYSLHSGFAEATIINSESNLRPAFPDNDPRIYVDDGLIRVNGLYRHGALLAPQLAMWTKNTLFNEKLSPLGESILH